MNEPKRPLNQYAKYSNILFQMIAIIALGTFLGVKLDDWYPNENNLYTVILATFSVILSLYVTVRSVMRMSKKDE